ncbi:MAG: (2Fe-2S)-binding protein [Cenarchaeum symbiont of Oopsacas minuta]|nr:(2Fe-2S)-binding protein [Cenarchaeum symbiont of Oopsacas minuta]
MTIINAGKVADMPPNTITKLKEADISIVNVNGEFYAITDTCTHAGASMANGKLDGEDIVCGWHGAAFNCKSGKLEKFPAKIEDLKSYKVTIENGDVLVEV